MTVQQFCEELTKEWGDDALAPGLQISFLPNLQWYVCVHRFRSRSVNNREYPAKATNPSLDEALKTCHKIWTDILKDIRLANIDGAK